MSQSEAAVLPVYQPTAASQAATSARSRDTRTPSTSQADIASPALSNVPSENTPTGISLSMVSAQSPSPAYPTLMVSSQTPEATNASVTSDASFQTTAAASTSSTTTLDSLGFPVAPSGYPKLALRMGDMPETAIFRRFGFLNCQNLLYMQAELVCLEERLRKLQEADNRHSGTRSLYATNWCYLSDAANEDDGDDKQWELVKEIREKLKEYNDMLIQQLKLLRVDPPGSYDLKHLQRFLYCEDMDNGVLTGQDSGVWGSMDDTDDHASDLLGLLGRHNEDPFSRWVTEKIADRLFQLKRERQPSRPHSVNDFADRKLLRWTFMIASVLASALPVVAIVILYWVQSTKARLGLIAVFNVLLSFSLAWCTSAKPAEAFAISAAFSAVQVVFVQLGTVDSQ